VDDSMRYFGCAVGFGFGVLWMTEGLGPAILCLLLAGLGYGAVFVAERARANPETFRLPRRTPEADELSVAADEIALDHGYVYEPADDASSPLAAESEYGWPLEGTPEVAQPEVAQTTSPAS
jgi:hypothetical protein